MKIKRNELAAKYGIELPKGKYSITRTGDTYKIYTVKDDTEGCLLPGVNDKVGRVSNSRYWFNLLNERIKAASNRGERVWCVIG